MTSLRREVGPAVSPPGVAFAGRLLFSVVSVLAAFSAGIGLARYSAVHHVAHDEIVDCFAHPEFVACKLRAIEFRNDIAVSGTSGHTIVYPVTATHFLISDGPWKAP